MREYFNHSGGCHGADMEWDRIGRELGFENHRHYRPSDLKAATSSVRNTIDVDIWSAAVALGRPTSEFPGKDLVRRNWFQAHNADAIYAVSRIVNPGEKDKGFVNNTGKQVVSGGTGWACQMAINMGKPVYVFDMNINSWHKWYETGVFLVEDFTPLLTKNYAGIGSRVVTDEGKAAIRNVYLKTLKHEQQ